MLRAAKRPVAHDMRNEFAEKFLPVLRGAREFTRDGKEVSAKREGGMKGKTGKRSVDRRGDQAKKTGKAARRSRLLREMRMVHRSAEEVSGGGQTEKGRQAIWNPEQGERDPLRLICSSIASEPLVP